MTPELLAFMGGVYVRRWLYPFSADLTVIVNYSQPHKHETASFYDMAIMP